jgi:hypothetical protein
LKPLHTNSRYAFLQEALLLAAQASRTGHVFCSGLSPAHAVENLQFEQIWPLEIWQPKILLLHVLQTEIQQ